MTAPKTLLTAEELKEFKTWRKAVLEEHSVEEGYDHVRFELPKLLSHIQALEKENKMLVEALSSIKERNMIAIEHGMRIPEAQVDMYNEACRALSDTKTIQ